MCCSGSLTVRTWLRFEPQRSILPVDLSRVWCSGYLVVSSVKADTCGWCIQRLRAQVNQLAAATITLSRLPELSMLLLPPWVLLVLEQARILPARNYRRLPWRACWTCVGALASCMPSTSPATAGWSAGVYVDGRVMCGAWSSWIAAG